MELRILKDGEVVCQIPLKGRRVVVGRAPSSDVVLEDERISWHHAIFWEERGQLWAKDLGSTNGTLVDGKALEGMVPTLVRAPLWLAGVVEIAGTHPAPEEPEGMRWMMLEVLGSGLRIPLTQERLTIGSMQGSDLHLPQASPCAATLMVYESGEVWLAEGVQSQPVEEGKIFAVAGQRLRITEISSKYSPTSSFRTDLHPYRLSVSLDRSPQSASLEELSGRGQCEVHSNLRVALLYVLGKKLVEDQRSGIRYADQGWCTNDEVGVGVWGREWFSQNPNSLHVMIHRIRRQLQDSHMDPWCIERRRGSLRIRVREVDID